jgi:hypothetical protein
MVAFSTRFGEPQRFTLPDPEEPDVRETADDFSLS